MKQEISREGYLLLVWISLIGGLVGNAIFSTIGIMQGFNYYTAVWMGFSLLLTGFGIGLSVARAFKIEGID